MEPHAFTVTTHPGDGALVIAMAGELDQDAEVALVRLATEALNAVPRGDKVAIDLAGVEFCGSAGIRALLSVLGEADRRRIPARITAASPSVRRVFELTGLNDYLPGD